MTLSHSSSLKSPTFAVTIGDRDGSLKVRLFGACGNRKPVLNAAVEAVTNHLFQTTYFNGESAIKRDLNNLILAAAKSLIFYLLLEKLAGRKRGNLSSRNLHFCASFWIPTFPSFTVPRFEGTKSNQRYLISIGYGFDNGF